MQVQDVIDFREPFREETSVPRRMTYKEIAADLTARIRSGEYPPGSTIPSYRQTSELYGVSIATAGKAINLLTERGLIEEDPGRANIVVEPQPEQPQPD